MILLQKKRIIMMIGAVFISIFSYLLGSSHMYGYQTVETLSLPVSGKVVILDAGHRTEKTKEHKVVMGQQRQRQIYQLH